MKGTSIGYWALLGLCVLLVHVAGAIWVYQVYKGLGIAGYAQRWLHKLPGTWK